MEGEFQLVSTLTSHYIVYIVATDSQGSYATGSFMLECRLYANRKIGSNDFIGGTKEAVELLLAEGSTGGQRHVSHRPYLLTIPMPLAITRELFKSDEIGNQVKMQTVIEFTIMAVPMASDIDILNMENAIAQGKDAVDCMKPPASYETIPGPVGASGTVTNNTRVVSDNWSSLLEKIQLFTELVDAISGVCMVQN